MRIQIRFGTGFRIRASLVRAFVSISVSFISSFSTPFCPRTRRSGSASIFPDLNISHKLNYLDPQTTLQTIQQGFLSSSRGSQTSLCTDPRHSFFHIRQSVFADPTIFPRFNNSFGSDSHFYTDLNISLQVKYLDPQTSSFRIQ